MSSQTRVITVIHNKLVGTAVNKMRIARDQLHGTSFGYNALYVRNINVSGNGSALPAVLFVTLDIDLSQCYTSTTFNRSEVEKETATRIPYYTANSADSRRLIAQCNVGEKRSIENKEITLQTLDVTTGRFGPFTDYTSFVVELEIEA